MSSLSRRALLRGLAGTAGGAMLLPLMSKFTKAAPPVAPRFVFVVESNCYEPGTVLDPLTLDAINKTASKQVPVGARWWYQNYNHTSPLEVQGTQFANTTALGAIAANGLANDTAVLFGLSSRVVGGGHSAEHGVLSSTRTVGGQPGGPTIETALATLPGVRGATPYDAVRLGASYDLGRRLAYNTCAYDTQRAAPVITDPDAAYTMLFGLVGSPAEQAEFDQRGRFIDYALEDLATSMASFTGTSSERVKLETYLATLQDGKARQNLLLGMRDTLLPFAPESPSTNPLYNENTATNNNTIKRFAGHLELATAALRGGLTNVAVVVSGSGGFDMKYPSANPAANNDITRHNLHHGSGSDPTYLQTIHDITKQQMDAIVQYMAVPLKNTPDAAGGSMLDHTVIVYISDNGEQHHSTASEFPVVLIGGSALGLKTGGRTIVYPGVTTGGAGHRQVSNLWSTLAKLAGAAPIDVGSTRVDFDNFGTEGIARVASGPLSELV